MGTDSLGVVLLRRMSTIDISVLLQAYALGMYGIMLVHWGYWDSMKSSFPSWTLWILEALLNGRQCVCAFVLASGYIHAQEVGASWLRTSPRTAEQSWICPRGEFRSECSFAVFIQTLCSKNV